MESYALGKDIQEIKDRLARIEEALGLDGSDTSVVTVPIRTLGVSLSIDIDIRRDGARICAKVKVKVETPLGDRSVSLPEVCLGADGICSSVTTGNSNPYASAEVCWRGTQICAEVTAGVKIGGRRFEASGSKCVDI